MIHVETIHVLSVGPSECVTTQGGTDARIAIDGKEHEVTLLPNHEGRLSVWGGLECWASCSLVRAILDDHLDKDQRRVLATRIEDAVAEALARQTVLALQAAGPLVIPPGGE